MKNFSPSLSAFFLMFVSPMSPDRFPDRKRPVHFSGIERHNRALLFFVTVCTKNRALLLANHEMHRALVLSWKEADNFLVGRYVVMPDHLHLFCAPAEYPPPCLGAWVRFWKSLVARRSSGSRNVKLWQRDYWDTQLRRGQSYREKWDYVRANPVRAGLVNSIDAWPYQGEIHSLIWSD